jgi:hypothetical protein
MSQMNPLSSRATAITAMLLLLATRDELAIAPAQPQLRVPGTINNGLGMPSCRRWMSGLTRAGCR